jgi:hypothetical protein
MEPQVLLLYSQEPITGRYAVPWLRQLVAGLSSRSPGFVSGSIHVGFMVDKVALGQVFPC